MSPTSWGGGVKMATRIGLATRGGLCAALGMALIATALPSPVRAAAFSSAFVIGDLPVDATGKSGVAARDAARAAAQKQALQLLLQRLTAASDWPRLPHLQGEAVTDLVLDMEVESEHVSASHYVGRYTFRFDPKGVRALLQQSGIPFTELVSKRVVAIPLFQTATGTHLWDDPNPWRDAWNAARGPAGLVPWVVPLGDLGDVQSLDVPDLKQPAPEKLVAMSQRYDGGDIVVASAILQDSVPGASDAAPGAAAAPVTLQITVTRYSATGTDSESTSVSADKPDAGFYLSGVVASERMLEDLWKKVSLAGAAPSPAVPVSGNAAGSGGMLTAPGSRQVEVEVPIAGAADWIKIRDRIAQVSGVLGTRIEVLTKDKILLQLSLSGEPQRLALAFAQQDLALSPGAQGGPMILSPHAGAVTGVLTAPGSVSAPMPMSLAPLPSQSLGTVPVPPVSTGAADVPAGQPSPVNTAEPSSQ